MKLKIHYKKYLAEFIGTFALVFIGCGACIAHHKYAAEITHVGVALAFGGIVMCMVYVIGHISGAHINPAVTIGFASVRRFPHKQILPYAIAQCLGAISASGVHIITFGSKMAADALYGSTIPVATNKGSAFGLEFLLTFFLMFVIMAVATDRRVAQGISGLAIGAVVCIDCLAAGKCCGASMNPARSLGPAIFAGGASMNILWLYIFAPILGAITAAVCYDLIRDSKERIKSIPLFDEQI